MGSKKKNQQELEKGLAVVHPPIYPEIPYCADMRYFFTHPLIQRIAGIKRWTCSGCNGITEKIPLDAWAYYDKHIIVGAKTWDEMCLMDLKSAWRIWSYEFPDRNAPVPMAFFLDWMETGLVCLDIEPECDPNLRNRLLRLPFLYGDFSLSGKGFHLMFNVPKELFDRYPDAQKKVRMQSQDGTYEILLQHYMTFTGNMLYAMAPPEDMSLFYTLFEDLCKRQKPAVKEIDIDCDLMPLEAIPYQQFLMPRIRRGIHMTKTPEDFESLSNYEFSWISNIMNTVYTILRQKPAYIHGHKYTEQEIIMLIYYTAKDLIPYREKHDTFRDGMPWVMHMAYKCVCKNPPNLD